jgi:hypothetical protein
MQDQFTKWMIGISTIVIVGVGSALFTTVQALREDTAVIKNELSGMKETVTKLEIIQQQIADHEYRLQWIERRDPDHTRTTPVRFFTPDTLGKR